MSYRLGVDIGGTFTDFALVADGGGKVAIGKRLTTPHDPSVAVVEGTREILARTQVGIEELTEVAHGTTLVTNAVIERKGASVAMLVTEGFSDVLEIAREHRYDLFDLRLKFPEPLVERRHRREVNERVRYDGEVMQGLRIDDVRRDLSELLASNGGKGGNGRLESIAVCLMHSYANPAHERRIGEMIAAEFPNMYVSLSSEIFPFMREYDRWTTAIVNAYAQPMVDRYLSALDGSLREMGFRGKLVIMASNGGTMTPDVARLHPVRMLESGPAAGVLMSAHHGRAASLPNLLTFDMGGTTAKGSLIRDYQPLRRYELEVARIHQFKPGSGLPVKVPVLDMIEIGAGGGSIAEVDERGVIRVGPRSAGADPGPACYGRGGTSPTLTDANLVLGYLDARFFLGGTMALDLSASERAVAAAIAQPLGLDQLRAAWGIHEVINEDVARAFRVHASERGIDHRDGSMIAFGGSGPIHALRIARKLKIPAVIFPVAAGVMSAFGLLASPRSFEIVRSDGILLADITGDAFAQKFDSLVSATTANVKDAAPSDTRVLRRLDMRYKGQGYEVEVTVPELPAAEAIAALPELFKKAYEAVFSISFPGEKEEIVNWKVEAIGPTPPVPQSHLLAFTNAAASAEKGKRRAYFPEAGGFTETPVYDRYALRPGTRLVGPALIEENESTCVIGVGDVITVDERYSLVAQIATTGGAA